MRKWVVVLLVASVLFTGLAGAASADVIGPDADLGPAAVTGEQARSGVDARARSLHLAMACGSESTFVRSYAVAKKDGKGKGDASWSVDLLLAKAALLEDPRFEWLRQPSAPICSVPLGTEAQVQQTWAQMGTELVGLSPIGDAVSVVNAVYDKLFGDGDRSTCRDVARIDNGQVLVDLTRPCLARQIRTVMGDPNHGPWKWADGAIVAEIAGTDTKALPCLSDLRFKNAMDGVRGDWDMAVLEYTRLAHVLYSVRDTRAGVNHDVNAALDDLNTRFLTLRSSPSQGATARESFNLIFSCGGLPNQSGSALDTVRGNDDPGVGRYPADVRDAVDGSTFWEDLLRFLVVLAFIVAAVLAAAIVGGFVAAVLGGGVGVAAVATGTVLTVLLTSLFTGSIPETENHLLMQNSSRYLKNKLMMAELSQQGHREEFDTVAELNEELRSWLLERMQRIAEEDFVEYNSKPYARLSHYALLNLIDFACDIQWDYALSAQMQRADTDCDAKDQAIVTAAAAVLDLSAAKAAVGSLSGRRLIPYRRLVEENVRYYDGRPMTELVGGADTMLAALQVWTGQMRYAPGGKATLGTFGQLVPYSTSHYRPDAMILDIAVNKSTPRWQQYDHSTREAYSSGNGWLITAGGTDERASEALHILGIPIHTFSNTNDRGVGVPTTLIIDSGGENSGEGNRVQDFLRFDGNVVDWGYDDEDKKEKKLVSYSDNNCVTQAFACGLAPRLPAHFDKNCTKTIANRFVAIDSSLCLGFGGAAAPNPAHGIYIAFYDHDGEWGFFEVAERSKYPSIEAFIAEVRARNSFHWDEWGDKNADDEITYYTTDDRKLQFTPEDEDFDRDRRACGVVNHEGDSRFTISAVPESAWSNCRSVGRRIYIDLDDEKNPIRRAEGGAPLDDLY